jgi:hypothetical protein
MQGVLSMETRTRLLVAGLQVILLLAGCTMGNTPPGNNSNLPPSVSNNSSAPDAEINEAADDGSMEDDAAEPAAESASESLCANRYVPVIEGASWSYSASASSMGSTTYTDSISGASSAGYTLVSTYDSLTKTQSWACYEDGLVSLEYSGGGDASVSTTGLNANFETSDMTGVTIPNQINPGDSWTQTFTVSGETVLEGGIAASTEGTVSVVWTAEGVEEVSVPAGSFEGVKVAVSTTLNFTMDMDGVIVPFTMTETGYIWLVEGVGWVRSETSYSFMEASGTSTVELTGYSIP